MTTGVQKSGISGDLLLPGSFRPSLPLVLVTGVVSVLLGLLYFRTGSMLEVVWRIDPSASHGYFVPFLAAYIVSQRLRSTDLSLPEFTRRFDVALGVVVMLTGISLHLLATLVTGLAIDGGGLILVLLGLVRVFGGEKSARRFSPAVLFLAFMIPLPLVVQQPIGETLQSAVSVASETALFSLGLPVYREGYMLYLPGHALEVAQGCSGLRQIMVFTGIGTFLGLIGGSRLHCVVMLLLTLPVAIIANTIRITAMGMTVHYAGSEWVEGSFHDLEGLIGSLIGLVILFWLSKQVTGLLESDEASHDNSKSAELPPDQYSCADSSVNGVPLSRRLALVIGVLLFSIITDNVAHHALAQLRATEHIPLRKPLGEFPKSLAGWTGIDTPVSRDYFLYGDDHLNRVYRNDQTGQTVTLWMIYATDGRDRGHHPQVCMRAFGCQEDETRKTTVMLPGEGSPADRFYFRKISGKTGEWVTYWYHVFLAASEAEAPADSMNSLLSKFRKGRSGLTIQLFVPERTEADAAAADEFVAAVEATIAAQLLPPLTRRSTRRGAFVIVTDATLRESN